MKVNILEVLYNNWDMIIAFPPCTHLAVSGTKFFAQKIADGRQQQGINFFMLFANHACKMIAIENPVGIMSSVWRKHNQIVQALEFGHPESKKTCLWLKGLPKLIPTIVLPLPGSADGITKHLKGKIKLWLLVNGLVLMTKEPPFAK